MEGQVWWPGRIRARRLKVLADENAKLKKLLAEAMLDNAMLKDLNSKKW
jgi:putative transposase